MNAILLAIALLATSEPPAATAPAAAPTSSEEARKAFKEGADAYQAGNYDAALQAFMLSYQLSQRGELLFDIAQSHRLLGHWTAAQEYYERYLAEVPQGKSRDVALQSLAEVKKKRAVIEQAAAQKAFQEGNYAAALKGYSTSYQLVPRGELLYDIAQCQRLTGHLAEAKTTYERYLAEVPDGKSRDVAQQHLDEINTRLAAGEAALPPSPDLNPKPVEPSAAVVSSSASSQQSHPRPAAIVLGSVGIAAGALAVVGLVEALSFTGWQSQPPGVPLTVDSVQARVNSANTWATVSLISAIAAAAGITGAVLTW